MAAPNQSVKDPAINDPFQSAEDPQQLKYTNEYWGQVGVDAWFCVLEKGVGKVPFEPNQHSMDRRLTAITMGIIPVPASGLEWSVDRDYIAEFRDWNAITLPSLKKLGVSLRDLDQKFVHVKLTETGETYVNSQGETKEKTVFEFLELFDTLEACEAAYIQEKGDRPNSANGSGQSSADGEARMDGTGPKEKEAAEKFLHAVVQNACRGKKDFDEAREAVASQIAKMPMIAKYFTVDSPETMNLMAEVMV